MMYICLSFTSLLFQQKKMKIHSDPCLDKMLGEKNVQDNIKQRYGWGQCTMMQSFTTNELKSKQKPILFSFFHNDIFCHRLNVSNTIIWKQSTSEKRGWAQARYLCSFLLRHKQEFMHHHSGYRNPLSFATGGLDSSVVSRKRLIPNVPLCILLLLKNLF